MPIEIAHLCQTPTEASVEAHRLIEAPWSQGGVPTLLYGARFWQGSPVVDGEKSAGPKRFESERRAGAPKW